MTEIRNQHIFRIEHAGKAISFEIIPEHGISADAVTVVSNADLSMANIVLQVSAECVEDSECDEPHRFAGRIADRAEIAIKGQGIALSASQSEKLNEDIYEWLCEQRRAAALRDHQE